MSGRYYSDSRRIKHFRARKSAGLKGRHRYVEVRYDHDSDASAGDQRTIDEVCSEQVHLERMSDDAVWMSVCGFHVWLRAERVKGHRGKTRIVVTGFPSNARPYVVNPGEGTLERHHARWDNEHGTLVTGHEFQPTDGEDDVCTHVGEEYGMARWCGRKQELHQSEPDQEAAADGR